ncbi:hypothetical protein BGX38DRAFT_1145167 [Terfezia claveryi]|nr:hypothetical protein BGX38DRAFT_1145167 [Terfezia claveryi]
MPPSTSLRCLRHVLSPANPTLLLRTTLPLAPPPLQSSTYATVSPQILKHKIARTLAAAAPAAGSTREHIHSPTQPPSFKSATSTKTLLTRLYLSLLRSSPLTILFQPNSMRATEWMAIRRELAAVLAKVDAGLPEGEKLGRFIGIMSVDTGLLGVTMRIADRAAPGGKLWTHGTSPEAAKRGKKLKNSYKLAPLLVGPLAVLTFPRLSPPHISAAMDMLFPVRRGPAKKGFDPAAASGLQKCILLGARVQERPVGTGKALNDEGIRWLSGLKTVDEMRGEIVSLLQTVGGGELVRVLESVAISLGRTVEGRRRILEEEAGGPKEQVLVEA